MSMSAMAGVTIFESEAELQSPTNSRSKLVIHSTISRRAMISGI